MKKLMILILMTVAMFAQAEIKLGAATTNTSLTVPADLEALAYATPTAVSNMIRYAMENGTGGFARVSGGLAISNGNVRIDWNGETMSIVRSTNTAGVVVLATFGEGYNGPPEGTIWTNSVGEMTWISGGVWWLTWDGMGWLIDTGDNGWRFDSLDILPQTLTGIGPCIGSVKIGWIPSITTNTYTMSDFVTDVKLDGVSGVKTNSTIYLNGSAYATKVTPYGTTNYFVDASGSTNFWMATATNGLTIGSLNFAKPLIELQTNGMAYIRRGGSVNSIAFQVGGQATFDGNATVAGMLIADSLKDRQGQAYYVDPSAAQSAYLNGPVFILSGKIQLANTNCWVISDGTNLFYHNVNGVVNALTTN